MSLSGKSGPGEEEDKNGRLVRVPITEARNELAGLIHRVGYNRERVALIRHDREVAVILSPADFHFLANLERQYHVGLIKEVNAENGTLWNPKKKGKK